MRTGIFAKEKRKESSRLLGKREDKTGTQVSNKMHELV